MDASQAAMKRFQLLRTMERKNNSFEKWKVHEQQIFAENTKRHRSVNLISQV
jgi:hypothetical protein